MKLKNPVVSFIFPQRPSQLCLSAAAAAFCVCCDARLFHLLQATYASNGSAVMTFGDVASGLRSGHPSGPTITLDATAQPLECWELRYGSAWRNVTGRLVSSRGGGGGAPSSVQLDAPGGDGGGGRASGVRYAYADAPLGCNLYNSAGLPAVPFIDQ